MTMSKSSYCYIIMVIYNIMFGFPILPYFKTSGSWIPEEYHTNPLLANFNISKFLSIYFHFETECSTQIS